jgi:pentatricopeptide repeat protein
MEDEGLSPDAVTFSSILNACGEVGAAGRGEKIHANIVRQGLLKEDITLGNALVDMYAKCGMLQKAQEVFDVLPIQDVVSWNALMTGYAQLGKIKNVLFLCNKMIAEDRMPDLVTFTVLLTACIHAGLVHEGELYFEAMRPVYGLIPTLDHSACLVDLFSSAGLFDKAIAVIEMASASDRLHLWLALLRACQKCSNVKLGRWVFNQVMDFDKNNCAAIVSMSNIYAAAG